jgi:hypothetical protein
VLCKDVGGKLVWYGAHCKFCKKELSGKSSSGTGQLIGHVKFCLHKQQDATSSNQTNLHFSPDGCMSQFEYNPAIARIELCRLLARLDLPLALVLLLNLRSISGLLIILYLNVCLERLLHMILMLIFLAKLMK